MSAPSKLNEEQVAARLAKLSKWVREGAEINRSFQFKNYHETMAFVNAAAWVSHREDHHPYLEVGYNLCKVRYTTHSAGGLSDRDFACAEKIDALFRI